MIASQMTDGPRLHEHLEKTSLIVMASLTTSAASFLVIVLNKY